MIDARASRNGEDASDLVTALLSIVGTLHNQAWLLSGDVRRLYGKIDATHRAADRLHRKIETMHAHIRILRSQDRLHRRKQVGRFAKTVVSLLSNRIDAVFQAVIIRSWEGHGPSRSCPFRFEQAAH